MNDSLDERIESLEIKIAFQDQAIEEMRDHILAQQQQIEILKTENREIMKRMKEAGSSGLASQDEEVPPPHY